MNIIKPSFEIITEQDPLKKIELCGRVCYKSEDKITADSAERFVKSLIERGHESVLEHAEIIIKCGAADFTQIRDLCEVFKHNYGIEIMLRMTRNVLKDQYIISGNVRMWRDFMRALYKVYGKDSWFVRPLTLFRGVLFDDVNTTPKTTETTAEIITAEQLEKGIETDVHRTETVRFIVDRGVSHEIVRHRMASFSQESTRYCNYGGEVTFIAPPFACYEWVKAMEYAEKTYSIMIEKGMKPQQARSVLPNSTKTELIMTTNIQNWKHFFELRTAEAVHPQMREVAIPLFEEMKRRWNE